MVVTDNIVLWYFYLSITKTELPFNHRPIH